MRTTGILLLAASCSFLFGCDDPPPKEGCGELVWVASGTSDHQLDFGTRLSCELPVERVRLRNVGACAVELAALENVSGDQVSFAQTFEPGAHFNVHLEATRIEPNQEFDLEVSWRHADEWRDVTAEVRLRGRHGETATLALAVRLVSAVWELPGTFDFGAVETGDSADLRWTISNPTQLPATWHLGEPVSLHGGIPTFAFAPGSPAGEVTLGPEETRDVILRFSPLGRGIHRGSISVGPPPCGELTTMLVGEGVSSVLSWEPRTVECGHVPVGLEVTKEVILSNRSAGPVELSQLRFIDPTGVRLVSPEEGESLILPAAQKIDETWNPGTAALTIACNPTVEGRHDTILVFQRGKRTDAIPVRHIGGGPDIDAPTAIDFGKVQWFVGASPPEFQTRRLTAANVGTVTQDPEANLRIETLVEVKPLNAQTQPGEFEVSFPASYDSSKGIVGNDRIALEVRFTPASQGLKEAELILRSNDLDEPEVRIPLSGNVMQLPSCDVSLSATRLDFGVVSPAEVLDLAVTVRNTRVQPGELCVVSGVDLSLDTSRHFSLPEGMIPSIELDPGEALRIPVRVAPTELAPTGTTSLTGNLVLHTSSAHHARVLIPLTAEFTKGCLTIAPRSLDFGTAQVGCSGKTETVRVYNRCTTPVTFNPPPLEPSGFFASNAPTTPVTFARGDYPVTFDVTFRPTGEGTHDGHLELSILHEGVASTFVVPVVGKGALAGVAVDSFTVGPRALDLLFVIGPTPPTSISGLAGAVPSFVSNAQLTGLDYQVAVTGMDLVPDGAWFSGFKDPIVRPTSADPAQMLSSRIAQTGGLGPASCFDAAVSALTPPLSLGHNAGFVRANAPLAVVCLSEFPDLSKQARGWQLDALRGLKGHRSAFTFNAISGFSDACPIDDGKLAAAADATGGLKEDLCTANWTQILQSLADLGERVRTNFELRSEPDAQGTGLTVTRNGAPVSASTWSWDATTNQILFSPVFAPLQGDTITVTYPVVCHP